MNKRLIVLTIAHVLFLAATFAQSTQKLYNAGNCFQVSLPDYMNRTIGLNDVAAIQFRNSIKDVAGFIIEDSKEDLKLADMVFSSIDEFYENFIKEFLINAEKRNISQPKSGGIGGIKYIEADASYYDKESNLDIYYFIGIAETNRTFYKVLCFGSLENKDKFKGDFQRILYSIKD